MCWLRMGCLGLFASSISGVEALHYCFLILGWARLSAVDVPDPSCAASYDYEL